VAEDVHKTYLLSGKSPVPALNGVDLEIAAGEFVAIMGPSGAGKSTLMHILALLDTPTTGRIEVSGHDVSRFSQPEQADFRLKNIGFIFQFFNLFAELSVLENVMLPRLILGHGPRESGKWARELLAAAGSKQDHFHLRPAELSGGDQQRAAIARALVNEPILILADEPTASMDSQTAHNLLDLFRQLNREKGQTIVMVTHEEEWGAKADRIIRLLDGRIV
jgi:putative ABC transport system ATP-binding protein